MGLFGTLFGKSAKSTSNSYNEAAPWVNQTFQPAATTGLQGINALAGFLGNDYNDYLQNTGFNFGLNEGLNGVVDSAAARGLLSSGPTQQALVRYGNDYARTAGAQQYQNALATLGGLGLNAGQLVVGANQRSTGTSKGASDGLLGKIGQVAGAVGAFSDRRLKTDVSLIGEEPDGLGVYRFRYLWDEPGTTREGVMADEVAQLRPWALGEPVEGYATVNYGAL